MKYFSGFGLKNEYVLFEDLIEKNPLFVYGFSYGAIKAFRYALKSKKRVDKLIFFSPAFFVDKDEKFKKAQVILFKKDSKKYIKNFLNLCAYPKKTDLSTFLDHPKEEELKELLNYEWKNLEILKEKNIKLEIHLGKLDKIVDAKAAYEFFKPYATIYYYNNKGHIL